MLSENFTIFQKIHTFKQFFQQNGAIRYFSSDCAFYCYGVSFSALIDISKQTYSLSFENAAIRSFAYFSFIQQGHKINMYYQFNDTQSNYNVNKISFKHFKKSNIFNYSSNCKIEKKINYVNRQI